MMLSSGLFLELELDRTFVEVCQKAVFVFPLLCRFCCVQDGDYDLPGANQYYASSRPGFPLNTVLPTLRESAIYARVKYSRLRLFTNMGPTTQPQSLSDPQLAPASSKPTREFSFPSPLLPEPLINHPLLEPP